MKSLCKIISILALNLIAASCDSPEPTRPVEHISAVINIVSGENQPGENGDRLNEPVIIKVTGSENNPLVNIQISFYLIDGGGGTLNDNTAFSNSGGFAETYWTLGNGPDHIMKVSITDRNYSGEPIYVFAQTEINLETNWISDIDFPRLYGNDVSHDNRILESDHYLIFSDASSDDSKIRFAKTAEETFHEVMQAFNIQESAELGIIVSDNITKPKLFANISTDFPYGGFAFNTGYVYPAYDSQMLPWVSDDAQEAYRLDVKHETVHIVQFLVGLDNLPNMWPDVWFSEGIAVYISNNRIPPRNIDELNQWRQIPGNDNPIKVHEWEDLPDQGRRYYQMFGLAVKYLLHENGHGKTTTDVLEMFRYMASSHNGFADAFEIYMGMSLQFYEDNYWEFITEFLERIN